MDTGDIMLGCGETLRWTSIPSRSVALLLGMLLVKETRNKLRLFGSLARVRLYLFYLSLLITTASVSPLVLLFSLRRHRPCSQKFVCFTNIICHKVAISSAKDVFHLQWNRALRPLTTIHFL